DEEAEFVEQAVDHCQYEAQVEEGYIGKCGNKIALELVDRLLIGDVRGGDIHVGCVFQYAREGDKDEIRRIVRPVHTPHPADVCFYGNALNIEHQRIADGDVEIVLHAFGHRDVY